ncbi:hypothetical protein ACHAXA_004922 [Cyclostephanos tholiformis]|uniref:Protein phosphatase inhibitor 2 n=1 Tax=Cyclostephanos tholiformis TaxID=382380 RepID=A0ABD3RRZ1_9STRA
MDATSIRAVNPILKKDLHYAVETGGGPSSSFSAAIDDASSGVGGVAPSSKSTKDKKHLVWDENAIEEHDLLRGTRMKIDEPKTPYTEYEYHSDADGESVSSGGGGGNGDGGGDGGGGGRRPRSPNGANQPKSTCLATHWNDVSSRLQAVADERDEERRERRPDTSSSSSSSTIPWNASDGEDEKKRTFADMRRRHYNEAEEIKRWKAEHADDDDDEDDDDDDDDDSEGKKNVDDDDNMKE